MERKKEVLRRDVDEGVDFVVVSEGVWKLLHSWLFFFHSFFSFIHSFFLKKENNPFYDLYISFSFLSLNFPF